MEPLTEAQRAEMFERITAAGENAEAMSAARDYLLRLFDPQSETVGVMLTFDEGVVKIIPLCTTVQMSQHLIWRAAEELYKIQVGMLDAPPRGNYN